MDALIAELESAAKGSRELDARVWCLVKGHEFLTFPIDGHLEFRHKNGETSRQDAIQLFSLFPFYTTSLDAALMLIPEGWILFGLRQGDPTLSKSNPEKKSWASIKPHQQNDAGWKVGVQYNSAPTPALAICVAALRARQAMKAA